MQVSCMKAHVGKGERVHWAAGQEQNVVRNDERWVGKAHCGSLGRTGDRCEEESSRKLFCLQDLLFCQEKGSEKT